MQLGPQELFFVLVIVVILFGATQLPKLGKAIGEFSREFKSGLKDNNVEKKDDSEPSEKS